MKELQIVKRTGTIALSALLIGACGGASTSAPSYPAGVNAPEAYASRGPGQLASAPLYLPGSAQRQNVTFNVVDGMAIYQGDIMLGPVASLAARYGMPRLQNPNTKSAVAVSNSRYLWPQATIPYEVAPTVTAATTQKIVTAIGWVNQTALTVRPRTSADKDYVVFRSSGKGCSSFVGRIGGPQTIEINGCGVGSVSHEILHASGFFHEQARSDRDAHITIMWDDIVPSARSNFEKRTGRSQDIGGYDFNSIMHYSAKAFSRNGRPTIVPKSPTVTIGQRKSLSAGDRAAVAQLYSGTTGGGVPGGGTPGGGGGGGVVVAGIPFPVPAGFPQIPGLNIPGLPGTQPQPTTAPAPAPTTAPPAPPTGQLASFAGNYTSTRGSMSCTDRGSLVNCTLASGGRLDCVKDGSGLRLSCSWATFAPHPGTGRATFDRVGHGRNLRGTWGNLHSNTDGGSWDITAQ